MKRVRCIDDNNSTNLRTGELYYCFPCNQYCAYISLFPFKNSHFGCYQLDRFEEVDHEAQATSLAATEIQNENQEAEMLEKAWGQLMLNL